MILGLLRMRARLRHTLGAPLGQGHQPGGSEPGCGCRSPAPTPRGLQGFSGASQSFHQSRREVTKAWGLQQPLYG
jgi:hypothetical protein